MLRNMIYCLAFLVGSQLFAQSPEGNLKIEQPFIEVNGSAEMEVVPDEIFIRITLRERMEGKEKISIDQQEADMKSRLQNAGIDLNNLSLSDAGTAFMRYRRRDKGQTLSSKSFILKTADAATVNKVFDILEQLQISDASIAFVNHSKIEDLRRQVKTKAMQACQFKATYLLEAIGAQLGRPLVIREVENNIYYGRNVANLAISNEISQYAMEAPAADFGGEVIAFQKIKLRYEMYARFEIK